MRSILVFEGLENQISTFWMNADGFLNKIFLMPCEEN
jgi:hypothetical protein